MNVFVLIYDCLMILKFDRNTEFKGDLIQDNQLLLFAFYSFYAKVNLNLILVINSNTSAWFISVCFININYIIKIAL